MRRRWRWQLPQKQPDAVDIELAASALFDSGNYELVRVTDPEGKLIVERVAATGGYDAPDWFVPPLPDHGTTSEAQISSGWKQSWFRPPRQPQSFCPPGVMDKHTGMSHGAGAGQSLPAATSAHSCCAV